MRTRKPLPKGKEAEEELARQRRNERRRLRKAKKAAEERGEVFDPGSVVEANSPSSREWDAPSAEFTGVHSPEQLKAMFSEAFAHLGGVAGLVSWGKRYPKEFYAIWARMCLPRASADTPAQGSIEDVISQLDAEERVVN